MLEQAVPERLHHMGGTHTRDVKEELLPRGRSHVGEVCGGLFPVGGTLHWNMERFEESSPQGQEQKYMMNCSCFPFPISLQCCEGVSRENMSETKLRKKGEVERKCFLNLSLFLIILP